MTVGMRQPTAIDLFCGAGGLSLGLQRAGFAVRAAVDINKAAVETYRTNLGDHVIQGSVLDIHPDDVLALSGLGPGNVDLLAGGPPCQGFSVQRRGPDDDHRNHLVPDFLRFVERLKPSFFLIENVPGLLARRGRPFLGSLRQRAAELGYDTFVTKLDAVQFGVPQFRVRVFVVGQRTDLGAPRFRFPEPDDDRPRWGTVRKAIGDLPEPPLDGSPHPAYSNHFREAKLSQVNLERFRNIPPGGGREDLPEHLQLPCHRNNPRHRHLDVYGRLAWDEPSVTLTARFDSFSRGRFGHPEQMRSLTLREGARIQTFPDSFVFSGNREEGAMQIGNAVPPLLAEQLGRSIRAILNGEALETLVTRNVEQLEFALRKPASAAL